MKRALLLGVLGLLLLRVPLAAQNVVVGVGGQLTGLVGATVRAPVYADMRGVAPQKLGSYTVRVQWDPAVLSYDTAFAGRFGVPLLQMDSAYYYGVLRVAGLSAAGVDSVVDLFTMQFTVATQASTTITLSVIELVAAGSFANLTGAATVVNGTYCTALGRWGDLDGDGDANSRDALAMLSAIVGLQVPPGFTLTLGDVDADGTVNSRDALITLSYAVGLAVPGQRVLVLAPGACGSTGTTGLTVLPDTVDIVPGQSVRVLLSGSSASGPAGTNAVWRSADPAVATVDPDGTVRGRSAGATTVTAALGPGINASVDVVVRARRYTWRVDGTKATLAAIQMGTTRYPFATPQFAFPFLTDGDTIRIAPGTHDYVQFQYCVGGYCYYDSQLLRGVVLIGDTLADGTRPVLRGNPDVYYAAQLEQGAWLDARNLVFRNFEYVGVVNGAARFVRLQNVGIESVLYYGGGVSSYESSGAVDSVVFRQVTFAGDTLQSDFAADLAEVRSVVFDRVTIRGQYGLYVYDGDSVDVRDSDLLTRYNAIYVAGASSRGGTGIYLARNRIASSSDYGLYAYAVRGLRSERNYYNLMGAYPYQIDVNGLSDPPPPGSWFASYGDSIVRQPVTAANYAYGPSVYDFDSLTVDSLTIVVPDSGNTFYPGDLYGNTVRLRGSTFKNAGSGYPLSVGGRDVAVLNSTFTGCRADCGTSYGVEADSYVDSLVRAEFTGNTFYRMNQAIVVNTSSQPYRVYVSGNTADSITGTAFNLYGDSIFVSDNIITRAFGSGIYAAPGSGDPPPWVTLQRNRVSAAATNGNWLLYLQAAGVTSTGDHVVGGPYGAYLYNYVAQTLPFTLNGDTLSSDSALGGYSLYITGPWDGAVNGSRILGGNYGAYTSVSAGSLAFDSTVFSGSRSYAIYTSNGAAVTVTGRKNNVTDNRAIGLQRAGSGAVAFTLGRFVQNRGYAVVGTVDASSNWWGSASGPGPGTGGDSVSTPATVNTAGFLTADPGGVSVPLAPPGGVFAAAAWRAPFGGADVAGALPAEPQLAPDRRADRAALRTQRIETVRARLQQLETRRRQRDAAHQDSRPEPSKQ